MKIVSFGKYSLYLYYLKFMRTFTKNELIGVLLIFTITFLVTGLNMNDAIRRARDTQRRNDVGAIADAIDKFHADYGYYPPSENGRIKMCKGENFEEVISKLQTLYKFDTNLFFEGLRPCDWVNDTFVDVLEPESEAYLKNIPGDPKHKEGFAYYYLSNGNRFQIYSQLEGGREETGYNQGVYDRNLPCGIGVCSYGKSQSVPIDRDIDEYEKELLEKSGQ